MNISNKITISRILLTFVFIFLLKTGGVFAKSAALAVFAAACVSDWIDGYLARSRGEITTFGKLMDPIADKVLVISAFIAFSQLRLVALWMVIVILLREFIVTGLRIFALAKGKVIEAHRLGKHKTISSYLAVFLIMAFIIFTEIGEKNNLDLHSFEKTGLISINILMAVVIIFTITSGANYIVRNSFLLKDTKNNEKFNKNNK